MIGQELHQYDVALCQYALHTVRAYLRRPAFAAYAAGQLDAPLLACIRALGADEEPPPLLWHDVDLRDLAETCAGGPLMHDRPWVPHAPTHCRSIDCAAEIRGLWEASTSMSGCKCRRRSLVLWSRTTLA